MIITLCGSARFERTFKAWNLGLTLAGHSVFTLTAFPSDHGGVKDWYDDETKAALDVAHLRKIDSSDAVMVLNRFAYIGESTLREIDYAKARDRRIYFLESWGKGLGIGKNHSDNVVDAMMAVGVGYPSASPIDTFSSADPNYRDPWGVELLGPAGNLRSKIAQVVNEGED